MKQLVRNGTIITGGRRTSAMAIADGAIVALGDDALEWTTRFDETIDLDGGTAIPGFRDGHAHPLSGGTKTLMLSLFGLRSIEADPAGRTSMGDRASRRHLDRGQRVRPHPAARQRRRGGMARRRRARSAGGAALDRLPHDVGELAGARAGRHHRRHARPRARHHRPPRRPAARSARCTSAVRPASSSVTCPHMSTDERLQALTRGHGRAHHATASCGRRTPRSMPATWRCTSPAPMRGCCGVA